MMGEGVRGGASIFYSDYVVHQRGGVPVKSTDYMKNDKRKKRRKGEGVKCGRRKESTHYR